MKKKQLALTLATSLFTVLTVSSCAGGTPTELKYTLALESGNTIVAIGDQDAVIPTIQDKDPSKTYTFTFESGNSSILTVDSSGVVKGVSKGTTTVTVVEKTTNTTKKLGVEVAPFSFDILTGTGTNCLIPGIEDKLIMSYSKARTAHSFKSVTSSNPSVVTVSKSEDGSWKIKTLTIGKSTLTATDDVSGEKATLEISVDNYATGAFNYSGEKVEVKSEILGKLEKYAIDTGLTGITLFEDGSTVLYSKDVQKGTNNYITGYGFGILGEGDITADLAKETKDEWKRYYHNASVSDKYEANALNSKDSEVGDVHDQISSSYWGTKMNATKDGYDWYPVLAKDNRPVGLDLDANNLATTWKFKVNTGADGLKFSTLSNVANRKAFNGKEVTLDDYVFAFKVLLTQSVGYSRGAELAAQTTGGIAGAASYYKATKEFEPDSEEANKLWANVGIKADPTDNSLTITLTKACTQFYAMYYLSSSLYCPINKEFFNLVGKDGFGLAKQEDSTTPLDNILCLSPYSLEHWEKEKLICYKRNPEWIEFKSSDPAIAGRYKIAGIHTDIWTAGKQDETYLFNQFLDGKTHASGIPLSKFKDYKNDPRAVRTKGSSTFKLNVNACTQEFWEYQFGENGLVQQTPKEEYWQCKPWMSNNNFLRGLKASLDRKTFAENRGYVPSDDFFSSAYLIDPENGKSYNDTADHKAAVADYFPDTYGYNFDAACLYFQTAVQELVAAGDLELGTKENPTVINIDVFWMYPTDVKNYGNEIAACFEKAFNADSVCGGKVKLVVNNHEGTTEWTDVYYKHLIVGQFDLGFGAISGNTLDPLNFMDMLRSDNLDGNGLTLCWGVDTSVPDSRLKFDDKIWSYDALSEAGDHGTISVYGSPVSPILGGAASGMKMTAQGEFNSVISLAVTAVEGAKYRWGGLTVYLPYFKEGEYVGMVEVDLTEGEDYTVTYDEDAGEFTVEINLSKEGVDFLSALSDGNFSIETFGSAWEFVAYIDVSIAGGVYTEQYAEVYYSLD